MPLVHFIDRTWVFVVVDGKNHRTLFIRGFVGPFDPNFSVTRYPFAFLGSVIWHSEFIHKLLIGDVQISVEAGFERIPLGGWNKSGFRFHFDVLLIAGKFDLFRRAVGYTKKPHFLSEVFA